MLQGLVEFTGQMAAAGLFGDGIPPEVRVRPTQEGSFIIEAVLHWTAANPEVAAGVVMPPAAGLVVALRAAVRRLRAAPSDFDYLPNGNVKIRWGDETVDEVPQGVWNELNKNRRRRKRTLRKLLGPLGHDADRLEVRDGAPQDETSKLLAGEAAVVGDRGLSCGGF